MCGKLCPFLRPLCNFISRICLTRTSERVRKTIGNVYGTHILATLIAESFTTRFGQQHLKILCRSHQQQDLWNEMWSPSQTRRLWVRVLLEERASVRPNSVFVMPCVGSGLVTGLIARSPTDCVEPIACVRNGLVTGLIGCPASPTDCVEPIL
jgi:hypothetical protein